MKLSIGKTWLSWSAIPLLAILAYATVLRIGFVSDDLVLLHAADSQGLDFGVFLPGQNATFYRPVGTLITWQLGWLLWGFNPLPYHLVGLLLHAIAALALGLWLAEVTSQPGLGWIGGALFAVFPLNSEAVGWVASQWDTIATALGLSALWLFTIWWKRSLGIEIYIASLACFALALFSKESVLTLLPIFPLSLLLMAPRSSSIDWRKLTLAVLPFGGLLALNIALRLVTWGSIGGYSNLPTDYASFTWDALVKYAGILIAPLNTHILPDIYAQSLTLVASIGLIAGLVVFGRTYWRPLLLIFTCILLSLLPVLNLYRSSVDAGNLQGNRFLYLASAGYCSILAILLFGLISSVPRKWQRSAIALPVALLILGIITCWIQLRPWHTATVMADQVDAELRDLIPPQSRPQGMVWYAEHAPDNYRGAYIFRLGLGNMRHFTTNGLDAPAIEKVASATETDLTDEDRDSYALRFVLDPTELAYHVGYGVGLTHDLTIPTSTSGASNLLTWDFRTCTASILNSWQAAQATTTCIPGRGLILSPQSADSQLINPSINIDPNSQGARFLRLRVAASYQPPLANGPEPPISQWFWKTIDSDWGTHPPISITTRNDNKAHVYWTFLTGDDITNPIQGLRFDPTNTKSSTDLLWIALDLIGTK